jgi:hypothetical protein
MFRLFCPTLGYVSGAFFYVALSRCSSGLRFSLDCLAWRQLPVFSPDNAGYATAASSSLIVAAFAPQRWLLPCLPPIFVARNSHRSATFPYSRRLLRRQSGEFTAFLPTIPTYVLL